MPCRTIRPKPCAWNGFGGMPPRELFLKRNLTPTVCLKTPRDKRVPDIERFTMAICKPCSESRHQLCAGENCQCVATHVTAATAAFEKARFAVGSHAAGSILIVCEGGLVREAVGPEKRDEISDTAPVEDGTDH